MSREQSEQQQHLEDVLEERDKGFFISLPADWKEQGMNKARQHATTQQQHLESILEERDQCPFIEITDFDGFKERGMEKARARLASSQQSS